MWNNFVFVLILCVLHKKTACFENVIGCGGFVKTHAPIDFTKIEIKLMTKQYITKESVNCAPLNGYYFLPVYDKGEYILKINPPKGWSFKPEEININVDGVEDDCSKGIDMNFVFQGFGITGQVVNVGSSNGPAGVIIKLNDGKETKQTVTSSDGSFYFTPVYPGTYEITANHPTFKISSRQVKVVVTTGNTEIPKNSLVVKGYSVRGHVSIFGKGLPKVFLAIFNQVKQKENIDECDKSVLLEFPDAKDKICHVMSDSHGNFNFPSVGVGKYYVRPYFRLDNIIYHIEPKETSFEVVDNNVQLPSFQVDKFTVKVRVLTSHQGNPIPEARIISSSFKMLETKADGSFLLEYIIPGHYDIEIEADGYQFKKEHININPLISVDYEFYPIKFKICGDIGMKVVHNILFRNSDESVGNEEITTDANGEFCHFIQPGEWKVSVELLDADKNSGIQFFPVEQYLSVLNEPKYNVHFSQLKAEIIGSVRCIRKTDCEKLKIVLQLMTKDKKTEYVIPVENSMYIAKDVIPGDYNISLYPNKFCWETSQQNVTTNMAKTVVPEFVQIGYKTIFDSGHNMIISYSVPKMDSRHMKSVVEKEINIKPGLNTFCLNDSHKYEFQLRGCHIFETDKINYHIDDPDNTIKLYATKHCVTAWIKTEQEFKDFKIKIGEKDEKIEGPLPYEKRDDGFYYYKLELFMEPKESKHIYPLEENLWYDPAYYVLIGDDDCKDVGVIINGYIGKLIEGKVEPAIPDVEIVVTRTDGLVSKTKTDIKGRYKFPAFNANYVYTITANKTNYHMTGPDEFGNFKCQRMGEVVVTILQISDKTPLQGVLISLSGAGTYRSNKLSNEEGNVVFSGLVSSEYFLRPMMKEYNFKPPSQVIKIKEGAVMKTALYGIRVAYSVYGMVQSLNGEPESKVIVTATGINNCSSFFEESTSEENGKFRIRGLHKYCSYEIGIRCEDDGLTFTKSLPDTQEIRIAENDVHDVKLIVISQVPKMDIVVVLRTLNMDNLKNLRVEIGQLGNLKPFHSSKIDISQYKNVKPDKHNNPGILLYLPTVLADNRTYYIRLTNNQQQMTETDYVFYFVANTTFKSFDIDYNPRFNQQDNLKQTSKWMFVVLLGAMIVVYNFEVVSTYVKEVFRAMYNNLNMPNRREAQTDSPTHRSDIDDLVQNINAPYKRKPKPRRT